MGPPTAAVKQEHSDEDMDGKVEAAEGDIKREDAAGRSGGSVKEEAEEPSGVAPGPGPQPRRMAGPAMPPRELLAAAAAAAEALAAAGPGAGGLRYEDDDDNEGGLLVGPPPPELVMELEAAPQDEREAEVVRIMKVRLGCQALLHSAVACWRARGTANAGVCYREFQRGATGSVMGTSPTEPGQVPPQCPKTPIHLVPYNCLCHRSLALLRLPRYMLRVFLHRISAHTYAHPANVHNLAEPVTHAAPWQGPPETHGRLRPLAACR